MGAPKGHPKWGGRQKGTVNKSTQTLIEKCEERGIDLFGALLELTQDEDKGIRLTAIKEAVQYVYPKRKALEHSNKIDEMILQEAEDLLEMTKEDLQKLIDEEMKKVQ